MVDPVTAADMGDAPTDPKPRRVWLWKNFVDGKPEYWVFDNPYPCYPNGDPMTLGQPCGYALVMPSANGRPEVTDDEVLAEMARVRGSKW